MRILLHWFATPLFWMAYGLFRSSVMQKSKKTHNLVMKLFRYAADNGSDRALSVYGHLLHFRGDGVQNRIQGAIYLEQAAAKGDIKAAYQMGRVYEQGYEHYFSANPEKALEYYRQAAEKDHPLAIKRLVEIYQGGVKGIEADPTQHQYWLDRRAQQSEQH